MRNAFSSMVDYFGLIEAITRTLAGGPSCAEDGMRFILNFAEWGLVFFVFTFFSLKKDYKDFLKNVV
ncbi:MAG: hypothetical protein Ct9H90mP22_2260 [Gammaproteobacteria bacterium]|nr:MAG: hypothetical protein Ct9H90mP22_2260 [Gammaproteobacteria bacterium]